MLATRRFLRARRRLLLATAAVGMLLAVEAPAALGADGDISTFAGGGGGGDGGPASAAALVKPRRVEFLSGGATALVEFSGDEEYGGRVRRVASNGTITTLAGSGVLGFSGDNGPASAAELNGPTDIMATPDGRLAIADEFNNRIRVIGTDGIIRTVAGTGVESCEVQNEPAATATLGWPRALSATADGGYLLVDELCGLVQKISQGPDGQMATTDDVLTTVAGTGTNGYTGDGGQATSARLNNPRGVAALPDGGFLIADSVNHRIRRVSPSGVITAVAGTGTAGFAGDGAAATAARLNTPRDVAVAPDGGYVIADSANHRVRWVHADGTISTIAGIGVLGATGDGGPANLARIGEPHGVDVSPAGDLYVAGPGLVNTTASNYRVRRVANPFGPVTPPVNQAPSASFGVNPASPAAGQQIQLTDTSTDADGTIVARAWDLDDDGQFDDAAGTTAQVTFPTAGTFTVRLQVTDDDGAPALATRQIVVGPVTPPASNLLANPSFETNTSGWGGYQATLAREAQAGAPAGGFVVKVTRSGGTSFTIDDGARAVPNLVAGTTYSAEVWVRAAAASSVGKPIQIKLRERTAAGTVVADVGSPSVALTTSWQKLTLSRTVVTAGGSLGLRVSHGGAVSGNAFYADAALLGAQSTGPPPNQAPTAAFTSTPAAPIPGQAIQLTDTSTDSDGTIAARAWDLDDDGQFDDATGAGAQVSFPAAGTYTVRLQVLDDDGAPAVATRQIVIGDAPPPNQAPSASFSQTPAAPVAGQQVSFADTSTDADGTIASRAWDLDDDGSFDDGSGSSAQAGFAAAGTYTVRLQVTDDDGAPAIASRQVVVGPAPANQAPVASFSQTPAAPTAGQQVSFADTSTDADGTIASRAWDLDDDVLGRRLVEGLDVLIEPGVQVGAAVEQAPTGLDRPGSIPGTPGSPGVQGRLGDR